MIASARVAFRDRPVVDVLDLALRFVVVQGRAYARLALIVLVPALAVALAAGKLLGWPLAWAVAIPVALAAELPFTVLASRLVFEDEVRVRDVVRDAFVAAPRVLALRIATTPAVAFGLAFLLVPGVWLAASFFFLDEVLVLERGAGALGRAQRLASNAVSDALLGVILLVSLPIAAVVLGDVAGRTVLSEVLEFRPPPSLWQAHGGVLPVLGLVLQVPLRATARFFLYLNVRTRVEGWDIQNLFHRIALGAETR